VAAFFLSFGEEIKTPYFRFLMRYLKELSPEISIE
jgi:hypothetical protein